MDTQAIKQNNAALFAELPKHRPDTKGYQDVVAKIVDNNMPLVINVAKDYFPYLRGLPLRRDDLIAEGRFVLMNAIKSYNPQKAEFSTYAVRSLKNGIRRCLNREHAAQNLQKYSLNSDIKTDSHEYQREIKDATVNVEDEIIARNERERQMSWVKQHLKHLTPFQRQVLDDLYLSGAATLTHREAAQKYECWHNNIAVADRGAIKKLKKLYYKDHPEAKPKTETKATVAMTDAEKMATGIIDPTHLTGKAIRDILKFHDDNATKER